MIKQASASNSKPAIAAMRHMPEPLAESVRALAEATSGKAVASIRWDAEGPLLAACLAEDSRTPINVLLLLLGRKLLNRAMLDSSAPLHRVRGEPLVDSLLDSLANEVAPLIGVYAGKALLADYIYAHILFSAYRWLSPRHPGVFRGDPESAVALGAWVQEQIIWSDLIAELVDSGCAGASLVIENIEDCISP